MSCSVLLLSPPPPSHLFQPPPPHRDLHSFPTRRSSDLLGDDVLEIETLYNRPDLTSIYGIAREVAALTGAELAPVPGVDPERQGDEQFSLAVEDSDGCPRFIARVFRDVRVAASPPWLKARLIGARSRRASRRSSSWSSAVPGSPARARCASSPLPSR